MKRLYSLFIFLSLISCIKIESAARKTVPKPIYFIERMRTQFGENPKKGSTVIVDGDIGTITEILKDQVIHQDLPGHEKTVKATVYIVDVHGAKIPHGILIRAFKSAT